MKFYYPIIWLILFISNGCVAAERTTVRLGVLAFGTVAWELKVMEQAKLAEAADLNVVIQPIANPEAGKIALQSGSVDMIVSDWIWVNKLRSDGKDYTFYPYSTTSGALVVAKNSPIRSIKDLKNKKVGIAGGELDKNWLLLQALLQKSGPKDTVASIQTVFGAPPLLNQQIESNRVDALLTYWHFAARLEAKGYRQIFDGQGIIRALGIDKSVPFLGYVFKESWAKNHKQAVTAFLQAAYKSRKLICRSDEYWQTVVPLTQTDDTQIQETLRTRYCAGNITRWGENERKAADQIYQLLKTVSANQLTGKGEELQSGTFWAID